MSVGSKNGPHLLALPRQPLRKRSQRYFRNVVLPG